MRIRYFAAAAAASGVSEEEVALSAIQDDGGTLGALLAHLAERHQPAAGATDGLRRTPTLRRVIERSSFLVNETNERDRSRELREQDIVDVLPPFAGG